MLQINGNSISLTKGNTIGFCVVLTNYIFQDGDQAILTVRKNYQKPIVLQTLAYSYDQNKATFYLDTLQTSLPSGTYFYDITLNLVNKVVDTVIPASPFIVLEGITTE